MNQKNNDPSLKLIKALQYVEGWATVKWHRIHDGTGIPANDINQGNSSYKRGKLSNMPGLFDAYIIVDEAISKFKNSWVLTAFFLWCYPKNGTYERTGDYTDFRPKELLKIAEELNWNEDQITESLKEMEHKFLYFLSKKL